MHHKDVIFPQKRLECAEGYLQLDMDDAALEELSYLKAEDLTSAQDKNHYYVLNLELAIRGKHWELGVQAAAALRHLEPDNVGAYVHGAYCLHELGMTAEALELLLSGPKSLKNEPLYFYNLGCYHAVLGDIAQARAYLKEAFQRSPSLKRTAREDPDLKGLGEF